MVVAYNISASIPYRRAVLGLANAFFIGSYLTDITQALPLLGFLLLGYACVRVLEVWRSAVALGLGVLSVLGCYVFLKRFSFFEDLAHLPFPYLTIGLSYILFRILHMMVDMRSGDLSEDRPACLLPIHLQLSLLRFRPDPALSGLSGL